MDDRLARRALSYVNLYCNTQCNSRCQTCYFWEMTPLVSLRAEALRTVAESRFVDAHTWFALQGGEFSLHPEADAILELFAHYQYMLFTNLLSFDRVHSLVQRHNTRYVTVSLDGGRDGYARIRGVDAFARVTRGILALRDHADVSVGFTLTPWTELRDYAEVAGFCNQHGIEFGVNVYTSSRIYNSQAPLADYPFLNDIVSNGDHPFAAAYAQWRAGSLKLPCHSIREVASISPDGSVHLCHNQPVVLGNILQSSFDDIWGSQDTMATHERYASCDDCWTSCYRQFDLARAEQVSSAACTLR